MRAVVAYEQLPDVERVALAVAGEMSAYVVVAVHPLERLLPVLERLGEPPDLVVVGIGPQQRGGTSARAAIDQLLAGPDLRHDTSGLALFWVGTVHDLARRPRPEAATVPHLRSWNVFTSEPHGVGERELRRAARWGAELAHEAARAAHVRGRTKPQSVGAD